MHGHNAVGTGFPSPVMPRGPDFGSCPGNAGSPLHVMAGSVIYGGVSVPRPGLVTVSGTGDDGLQQEAAVADVNGKEQDMKELIFKCNCLQYNNILLFNLLATSFGH